MTLEKRRILKRKPGEEQQACPVVADPRLMQEAMVEIIGCGGTGGFAAEALCRLFTGRPMKLTLTDHDVVEPHNLLRQNFYARDLWRNKAEALAERLTRDFGISIGYRTEPFGEAGAEEWIRNGQPRLIIGCVDNAEARRAMEKAVTGSSHWNRAWWIDAGNGETWGQVLLGNSGGESRMRGAVCEEQGCGRQTADYPEENTSESGAHFHLLPSPATQRPDLLTHRPESRPDVDCAAALDLTDQDPNINRMMAGIVTMAVKDLLTNRCDYMGIYLDMQQAVMNKTPATPLNVARAAGLPTSELWQ